MPNMNMEVIVSFVDRLSGPAREAAESLNKIKTSAEGLSTIGEHFTSATTGLRNAGTIFKNAGEGASQLAGHLRALEGLNVAPKLEGIGAAAKALDGAGAHMRSTGKGAEQLATGIRALEGLDVSKVTAIAGALDRVKAGGAETTMGSDMGKFAGEATKGATAVERLERALGGVVAHAATLAATPALSGLGGLASVPSAAPRTRPGTPLDGEQGGEMRPGPWHRLVPGQAPGTSVPTIAPAPAPIAPPAPIRAPQNALTAPGIALPQRSGITGAPGHRTFLDDMAKAHHRHLTNELGGAVQLGVQPLILSELAHSVFEQSSELDKEMAIGKANGLPDDLVQGVLRKAQNVARAVPQTDIAGNFKAIMALRMASGGNLDEAESIFGMIAKAGVYVGSMTGKKQTGDTFAESAYDMVRTGELKGDITNPEKFKSLVESMARTAIYSEGKVTPQSYHATAVYLRGALQGLSDEFFNNKLPFIAQELASHGVAGSQAGSAIAQVSQVVGNSGVFSKNVENWIKFGLADPSKVTDRGTGKVKFMPDALYNRDMERRDPQEYAHWVRTKLEEHGFVGKDKLIDGLNMLSGNLKFKQAMEIMMFQEERMNAFSEYQGQVLGVDDGYKLFNNTMSGAGAGVMGRLNSAKQTAGEAGAPIIVPALQGVTHLLDRFTTNLGGGGDEEGHMNQAAADLAAGVRIATNIGASRYVNPFLRATVWAADKVTKLPLGGMIGEAAPVIGRGLMAANPYLDAAMAGNAAYSFLATPNTLGMGEGFDDARSKAIDAAALAKRTHTDYANAGPDILPAIGTPGSGIAAPVQAPTPVMAPQPVQAPPVAVAAAPVAPPAAVQAPAAALPTAPATIKAETRITLPDQTPAGAEAGSQIAAGVASAAGAVEAQAAALMAKIRAVLGGGVDVPVHLQTPAIPGVPTAAGAAPAAGPEKHAALAPAVKAGAAPAQHVAMAGPMTHIDNRKTSVVVHVAGNSDPKATAKAVHDEFKTAARSQLSDGLFS